MKTIAAIPFYFCLFVMILLLSSCGLFHKVQTSQHINVDSTSASHVDSSVKKGIDTTKTSTFISSNGDSVAVELLVDTTNKTEYKVSYNKETHTVTSNQPIKKAVFKTDNEVAYSNFNGGIDTTLIQVSKVDTTHVQETIQTKNKEVTRKGASIGQRILIVIAFVMIVVFWAIIFYLRRKKETTQQLLKELGL
jgi:alpha-glucosidase (family GH31 glycosyl hydrolase)